MAQKTKNHQSTGAHAEDDKPIRLLNAAQAAEALNVSPRQIYNEVRAGRLGAVHIGTRVLFRP